MLVLRYFRPKIPTISGSKSALWWRKKRFSSRSIGLLAFRIIAGKCRWGPNQFCTSGIYDRFAIGRADVLCFFSVIPHVPWREFKLFRLFSGNCTLFFLCRNGAVGLRRPPGGMPRRIRVGFSAQWRRARTSGSGFYVIISRTLTQWRRPERLFSAVPHSSRAGTLSNPDSDYGINSFTSKYSVM